MQVHHLGGKNRWEWKIGREKDWIRNFHSSFLSSSFLHEEVRNVKTFGLTINLRDDPELIEKYKEYHRNVWPETEQALKVVGITAMKIYLLGRSMFMYIETVDDFVVERDFLKYLEQHPKCREWDELMRTFQEKVPEAKADEWWAMMEQVYDLK